MVNSSSIFCLTGDRICVARSLGSLEYWDIQQQNVPSRHHVQVDLVASLNCEGGKGYFLSTDTITDIA